MRKVLKFGGTSLSDAKRIENAVKIIEKQKPSAIVVSAPGKRFCGDEKITDLLVACCSVQTISERKRLLEKVLVRFSEVTRSLGVDAAAEEVFSEAERLLLETHTDSKTRDFVVGRGEYLCAKIVAECCGGTFVDGKEVVFFGQDGLFDVQTSVKRTAIALKGIDRAVVPGFYGCDACGNEKLLPRGGSDVSGSIVAAAINGKYYNYTDVNGFCRADPNVSEVARPIAFLSYGEAERAASRGATVVHPDAISIAREYNVEIIVKNTFNRAFGGTVIGNKRAPLGKDGALVVAKSKSGVISVVFGDGITPDGAAAARLSRVLENNAIRVTSVRRENSVVFLNIGEDKTVRAEGILCEYLFGER